MAPIWYCHALILWAPKSWIWGLLYEVLLVSVLVLVFFRILKRLDIGGCAGLLLLLLPQKSRAFLPNFSSEVVEVKQVKFLKKKLFRSNLWISWMYRYHFYDLKEHFWWPNKRSKYIISSLNTLCNRSSRVKIIDQIKNQTVCIIGPADIIGT